MRHDEKRRRDIREARLIFATTFPLFLFVAVARRFLPDRRLLSARRLSVIAEAKAAAGTCMACAFMG